MEQSICVRKMMATIKLEDQIPPDLYSTVRDYLMQAFAAGYDSGREEVINARGTNQKVVQCSLEGKVINIFNSIHEAARKTQHSRSTIERSLKGGKPKYHKFRWRFAEKEKSENYPGPF